MSRRRALKRRGLSRMRPSVRTIHLSPIRSRSSRVGQPAEYGSGGSAGGSRWETRFLGGAFFTRTSIVVMYPPGTWYLCHTASETRMKVALIGASGTGGSRLLAELNRRGHQVTAIARHPEKVANHPGVTAEKGDVFDKPGLVALIKGHDAVISSVHFSASDPKLLIEAVKESGVKHYFVVRRQS